MNFIGWRLLIFVFLGRHLSDCSLLTSANPGVQELLGPSLGLRLATPSVREVVAYTGGDSGSCERIFSGLMPHGIVCMAGRLVTSTVIGLHVEWVLGA
jgi:hypothetical protein